VPEVARYADDDPATVKRLGLIVDIETTRAWPQHHPVRQGCACAAESGS
jgi:hypothetical protein